MNAGEGRCPLCGRPIVEPSNRHHLLPLSKGGKGTETVLMHRICHDKIHAVFTEGELQRTYNSIEKLLQHEEIRKFVAWVRKKEAQFYDKSVKMKR